MKLFLSLFLAITTSISYAKESDNLSIRPIVGFERVQKLVPSPSMKTRFTYGVEALYKLPVGTAEAEVTKAQDDSLDLGVTPNVKYEDEELKARIGLRGTMGSGFFSAYVRGGAQGRQNKQTKTVNGVSTTSTTVSKVQPYVGTGLGVHVGSYFSLDAGVTVVYAPTSKGGLSDFEYSPTLGFGIHF